MNSVCGLDSGFVGVGFDFIGVGSDFIGVDSGVALVVDVVGSVSGSPTSSFDENEDCLESGPVLSWYTSGRVFVGFDSEIVTHVGTLLLLCSGTTSRVLKLIGAVF